MFKFKFKNNYCKDSTRVSFNTTLDSQLVSELKYISENTNQPISKLIETALYPHLQSQESFDNFLQQVKYYQGYNI